MDLIGNSEDRFSHDAVHIISLFPCLKIKAIFCFDAHEQNKTIIRKNKNGPSSPTELGRGVLGLKNIEEIPRLTIRLAFLYCLSRAQGCRIDRSISRY